MAEPIHDGAAVLRTALRAQGRTAPSESESDAIRAAFSAGEFSAVLTASERLLRDNAPTPQVVGAFCAGLFRRDGPACLSSIFSALNELVGPGWLQVAVAGSREKQCEAALASSLRDTATFWQFAVSQPSLPGKWREFDRAAALATMNDVAVFRAACASRWESPRFMLHASEIEALLRAVRPSPTTVRTDVPLGAPTPRPAAEPELVASEPIARSPHLDVAPTHAFDEPTSSRDEILLPVSWALRELLDRMDAFDTLIEAGEPLRAAIVADDIQKQLAAFDPRRFLPALFSGHIARRVAHRAVLAEARQVSEDEWSELEQLYRVDLHAFVGQ
ncbi:MAG: type VI secretion system protein IglI family protein [Deltaproteobacteria bacterium]|nr:type VI secretion system protein IglI family protein [Deltaproteobacteria bacterium]